jgi:5'-nucleotidase/UDP-sugar diphosphatase
MSVKRKSAWGLCWGAVLVATFAFSSCKKGDVIDLTILHTNDIHYTLNAPKSDEFGLGGVARLSTLIKARRQVNPLSITLDAGDWSEGNWYFNLDAGATMLKLFGVMGFDAAVIGNHDYLSGPKKMISMIAETAPTFPVLGANFDLSDYSDAKAFRDQVPGTTVINRNGLKIGVIGLSTVDYVYSFWLNPVKVSDPVRVAQEQARLLRPQVDILLLLSHNSFATNEQLARTVYGVDAVISGHSHKKVGQAVLVSNAGREVPVVETGSWGRYLGELHLAIDIKNKSVRFADYQLHPVFPDLDEDPQALALVQEADRALNRLHGSDVEAVIGETEIDLRHDESHVANLGDIASQSYRAFTGADAGFEILPLTGVKLKKGPITVRDAHDIMPHIYDFASQREWTIKVLSMRGQDLALFLNLIYFTNTLPLSGTGFFSHAGIEVDWRARTEEQPVSEIRAIRIQGVPLQPERRYRVALTDGLLLAFQQANEKLNLGIDLSQLTDTGVEAWRSFVPWIQANSPLTEQKLRTGLESRTLTGDFSLAHYRIEGAQDADGNLWVEVEVQNSGLSAAQNGRIECFSGIPDDARAFDTPAQKWTSLGTERVERLEGNASQRVRFDIGTTSNAQGVRRIPILCQVQAPEGQDSYPGNNAADTVLGFRAAGQAD